MDTSKAIGIIIANPEFEDVRSLEGVAPTKNPSVPIIAVPTTAGTAAEVTINYVITDVEKKRKFVCVDTHDIPVAVSYTHLCDLAANRNLSLLPYGLLCYRGHDRIRGNGRADQIRILSDLQRMHQYFYLSGYRALDLGRRLAFSDGLS